MPDQRPILVVGAGFAGAVYARTLAESGFTVVVIDRRSHIAGNAYDELIGNVRVHRYGPHLFHTNDRAVVEWLQRFGVFVPYEHRVQALLDDGRYVPLPVNRATIEAVFNVTLDSEDAVQATLRRHALDIAKPRSAAEYLQAHIGTTLTDLFFRPYTKKMWDLDLEEMDALVVKRIPVRTDDEDRYFPNDRYQLLPRDGYTKLFENVLDHSRISVRLNETFERAMLFDYAHCFNSMPIDEYFGETLGPLPYRSIRFHHQTHPSGARPGRAATINFTNDGPLTRETDWSKLPYHKVGCDTATITTTEEPCDYRDNGLERYYPVKTNDGRNDIIYRKYKAMADAERGLTFIGRCGTYQYLDMHQVINQSLASARKWLAAHPDRSC